MIKAIIATISISCFSLISSANTCLEGTTREGFASPSVSGGIECTKATQICTDGNWVGPMIYETCENHTKNCGSAVHGSIETGFLQPTTPKSVPCPRAVRTCINGIWTGPDLFPTCTEF